MLTYLKVLGTEWDKPSGDTSSLCLTVTGSRCDGIMYLQGHFVIPSQPIMMRRNQCCVSTFNNKTGQYLFLFGVFKPFFSPTQDHLSVCHPRNTTKGQTQRAAWIIACPQLEKHGMQLFSSHLHNRPRNTERSQKVFHCLCWVLMIRQYIWAHQTQLTSPDRLVFELKNIKQENRREQTTVLNPRVPVTLTSYGVCNENGIWQTFIHFYSCIMYVFIYLLCLVRFLKKKKEERTFGKMWREGKPELLCFRMLLLLYFILSIPLCHIILGVLLFSSFWYFPPHL